MATWNLDATHSELEFKVRHMMISTVKGYFDTFSIDLQSESENLADASVTVTIDAASVNTNSEQRDQHLKSGDFFDVEKYPNITFKSTSVKKLSDDEFEITGDLTIKDITKSITVSAEFGGIGKDPWGNSKAGYTVSGKLNRGDFGLNWNAALETGGVLVSDEVKFTADIQFVKS